MVVPCLQPFEARGASAGVKGGSRRCLFVAAPWECPCLQQALVLAAGSACLPSLAASRRVSRVLLVVFLICVLVVKERDGRAMTEPGSFRWGNHQNRVGPSEALNQRCIRLTSEITNACHAVGQPLDGCFKR